MFMKVNNYFNGLPKAKSSTLFINSSKIQLEIKNELIVSRAKHSVLLNEDSPISLMIMILIIIIKITDYIFIFGFSFYKKKKKKFFPLQFLTPILNEPAKSWINPWSLKFTRVKKKERFVLKSIRCLDIAVRFTSTESKWQWKGVWCCWIMQECGR